MWIIKYVGLHIFPGYIFLPLGRNEKWRLRWKINRGNRKKEKMHQSPGKCLKIANFLSYKLLTFNCNIVNYQSTLYISYDVKCSHSKQQQQAAFVKESACPNLRRGGEGPHHLREILPQRSLHDHKGRTSSLIAFFSASFIRIRPDLYFDSDLG